MKNIEKLLTKESKLCFTNGEVISGSSDVSKIILKCCEGYNAGYIDSRKNKLNKGIVIGVTLTGAIIGISEFISRKNKTQK